MSPPINRLKIEAGLSRIGKLNPAFALPVLTELFDAVFIAPDALWPPFSASGAGVVAEIRDPVLSGVAVVLIAVAPETWNVPMKMPRLASPAGIALIILTTSRRRSTIVRSGPPASVLNASAIVISVTSPPPTRWLRSESTGIGAYNVSITGFSGLVNDCTSFTMGFRTPLRKPPAVM